MMLAPALREPPFSLCWDDLVHSLPRTSWRTRQSWARSLRLSAALALSTFASFMTLEIVQRVASLVNPAPPARCRAAPSWR
jgi:hypothetical protein